MNTFDLTKTVSNLRVAGFKTPDDIATVYACGQAAKDAADPEDINRRLRQAIQAGDSEAAARAVLDSPLDAPRRLDLIELALADAIYAAFPWRKAYLHAAKLYDAIAGEFTSAARSVDPDEAPDVVVQLRNPARQNWADMPALAQKVEKAANLLCDVAAYAIPGYQPFEPICKLGLLVDATKCTDPIRIEGLIRPKYVGGRGGRWADLLRMGCTLRAADIDNYTPLGLDTIRAEIVG